MTKKWLGQTTCDICNGEVSELGDTCYDAVTYLGPWAFMCKRCYMNTGKALGREYDAKTLLKIRDLHK